MEIWVKKMGYIHIQVSDINKLFLVNEPWIIEKISSVDAYKNFKHQKLLNLVFLYPLPGLTGGGEGLEVGDWSRKEQSPNPS